MTELKVDTAPVANSDKRAQGKIQGFLGALISIVILCVALWFLHRELSHLSASDVLLNIGSIPWPTLALAVLCTVCGYLTLTGYDAAAMRYIGRTVRYRYLALTSFMAFAVGHNVGVNTVSGGSIRYRMYSLQGLSGFDIAQVIVFITLTFALGAALLLGAAMLTMPASELKVLHMPPLVLRAAGFLLLAVPFIYLLFTALHRKVIRLGGREFALPGLGLGLAQVGLAVADLSFASATLYVLLAPELHLGFLPFLGVYLLAISAGLISSVPGGLGVFEAVMLLALPQMDTSVLLSTIIVYRLIYYVAPFSLALLLFVGNETRQHRALLKSSATRVQGWISVITPQVVGAAVFLAGAVLLISGSTPAVESRLNFIAKWIPLSLLELSHLTGSVVGVGLLVLARGLHRRLQGAYSAALVLLSGGILASLLKGFDFEEAIILSVILGLLWASRDEFYRQGSLTLQRFTPLWIASFLLVICIAVWVALISFRHVEYRDSLWWQFALHADAPRMLRATLVAATVAMSLAIWKLLHAGKVMPVAGVDAGEAARVREIVATCYATSANVALLGDKRFIWSDDKLAFIMYQLSGNSWIALGDPVGPLSYHEDLLWSFREMVDQHDGKPVFYQVSSASLAIYVDMGLTMAKLGEDAMVNLDDFSLQGSRFADFRHSISRAEREGAVFEVLPRAEVAAVIAELRTVSDDWLKDKGAKEKGFSLGAFSEPYLENFDCAVVRVRGSIVAFANLWTASAGGELSVDLMRFSHAAPKSVMDYMFTQIMLWGKANGYKWFSLGMAPLSGLQQHALAPLWHKVGHLIFSHGESFYNFEGLRHFKEKFHPQWQPRYIACPGGLLGLPHALLDTSLLISGGLSGIVPKK